MVEFMSGIVAFLQLVRPSGSVLAGYRRKYDQVTQEADAIDDLVTTVWLVQEKKRNSIEALKRECRGEAQEQQVARRKPESREEAGRD
jgi:hypothetical protein